MGGDTGKGTPPKRTPRIVQEDRGDEHSMIWHVNIDISKKRWFSLNRPLDDRSRIYLEHIGEVGTKIIQKIFEIDGVRSLEIQPYDIKVHKGPAFDWEGIEQPIIEVLREILSTVYSVEKKDVKVEYPEPT